MKLIPFFLIVFASVAQCLGQELLTIKDSVQFYTQFDSLLRKLSEDTCCSDYDFEIRYYLFNKIRLKVGRERFGSIFIKADSAVEIYGQSPVIRPQLDSKGNVVGTYSMDSIRYRTNRFRVPRERLENLGTLDTKKTFYIQNIVSKNEVIYPKNYYGFFLVTKMKVDLIGIGFFGFSPLKFDQMNAKNSDNIKSIYNWIMNEGSERDSP